MSDDHVDFWIFWAAFITLAAGWVSPLIAFIVLMCAAGWRWRDRPITTEVE